MELEEVIMLLKEMRKRCLMPTASDPKRLLKAQALEIAIDILEKGEYDN